ncbi:hypothetical protein J6590_098336 [Homalodisca vitripennis]|nr:hypothetical protein J6590_094354 [Homalodisca vitripennis]KAG8324187.1 hypothetical protein J6590_098336 [Homalodisca vitripennis]
MKLLDSVSIICPIRGHSYLECDKNMALINQKAPFEVPDDWRNDISNARSTPEPFKVVNCKQNVFQNWTDHLSPYFAKDCPFPTRPLRERKVEQLKPGYFLYRNTYTGAFTEIGVQQKKGRKQKKNTKTAKEKPKEPTEMVKETEKKTKLKQPPPPPPLPP